MFTRKLFDFLRELTRNNNREWFIRNKPRYETDVNAASLAFIEEMEPRLRKISPYFEGSLMRIYRDVRFSKDKIPYNTHVGIPFRHVKGTVGFYLHLSPGDSFLGTGIWHPEPDALAPIRNRIASRGSEWKAARDHAAFRKAFGSLAGESLKRPPQGFAADHPHIEDLKRKDFVAFAKVEPKEVLKPGFPDRAAASFAASKPLVKFICTALGLPF